MLTRVGGELALLVRSVAVRKRKHGFKFRAAVTACTKVERQRRLPISAQGFQPWDHESTPDETL
jgi:ribosomal protein L34